MFFGQVEQAVLDDLAKGVIVHEVRNRHTTSQQTQCLLCDRITVCEGPIPVNDHKTSAGTKQPMNLTQQTYRDWVAGGITAINEALAGYDTIAGIVWDIRGNTGGAQELGIALMDSFGSAAGSYGNCYARVPESSPADFSPDAEYPLPYAVFVDDPLPSITFDGPQVLLTDGLAASAADWMAFAAARAGVPVLGNHSMGAFGYQTGASFVNRSIPAEADVHDGISLVVSGARCVNAAGDGIEGQTSTGTVVEFEPADLAAGIDTQLERAAAAVLEAGD